MKKLAVLICGLVAIVLIYGVFTLTIKPDKPQDNPAENDVKKVIVMVYENKDTGADNDFSKYMDADLANTIVNKIAPYHDSAKSGAATIKENYTIQIKLLKQEMSAQEIKMTFQVLATFHYENAEDINSGYSEEVSVVYDCERELITDFHLMTIDAYSDT